MPSPAQARNRIQVMRVGEHFLSGIQAGAGGGLLPGTGYMGLLLPWGRSFRPSVCFLSLNSDYLGDHPH